MNEQSAGKYGFLEGLSAIFRGSKASPETAHASAGQEKFKGLANQLNAALDGLKQQIEKRRAEAQRHPAVGLDADGVEDKSNRDLQLQEQAAALERAQASMRVSVLKLHSKLGTGIDERQLSELEQTVLGYIETTRGIDLDARIRCAILDRLLLETGALAWDNLQRYMAQKQLSWGEPDSRSQHRAEDQGQKYQHSRAAEVRQIFMSKSKEQCVHELWGMVDVWKTYPGQDSWLWHEVSLRSVGMALRLVLLRVGVDQLRADSERFRATVQEHLQKELESVHQMLSAGVESMEDANLLLASTDKVIREVLPEIAWEWVERAVSDSAAGMAKR